MQYQDSIYFFKKRKEKREGIQLQKLANLADKKKASKRVKHLILHKVMETDTKETKGK